jgi:DNA-directed RNA polymerase specialized sigma subunit
MTQSCKKYYIDNLEILNELSMYNDAGVMSENLGCILLDIANNLSNKGSFAGYTWKDDMVGEAILTCMKYLKNFDINKSTNAFSYITQIMRNSFINYIKIQNRHGEIKNSLYESIMNDKNNYIQI